MDFKEFILSVKTKMPVGTTLQNPGGGTSTVSGYGGDRVCYERGHSKFYVELAELWKAIEHFEGQLVTTVALKEYKPSIFDSSQNGHHCNCTFMFLLLQEIGAVHKIQGTGRIGNPFGVQL
jgi:hypothetical protein